MKKTLLFCSIFAVILLTGCGNTKTLDCHQKVSSSGIDIEVNMYADFGEDKLEYLGLKYGMNLADYTDEQIDLFSKQDMCSLVKGSMGTYSDAFTNCKQKVASKQLLISADFDLSKLDDSLSNDIQQAKTELESQGYTCTIK